MLRLVSVGVAEKTICLGKSCLLYMSFMTVYQFKTFGPHKSVFLLTHE